MKNPRVALIVFAFAAVLCGSAIAFRGIANAAKVVNCWVSISPQAFLAKSIGADRVGVRVMVGPGQVPHTYEPTARQLAELSSARLYFFVGVAFEEALVPRIERNFPGVRIVDMSAGVRRRFSSQDDPIEGTPDGAPPHGGSADAHDHRGYDPHVWLSPRIAAIMARNTKDALVAADPAGAEIYEKNCRELERRLEAVDNEISGILHPYAGREIFVFHPAYGYFTDAYGLKQTAIEENGAAPGPRHLAEVIDRARAQGTKTVFIQPQVSASYAETVAKSIGARIVALDPLAEDYIENLRKMAREIASGLDEPGAQ
jgi:zinc transport system substrate-binding protein